MEGRSEVIAFLLCVATIVNIFAIVALLRSKRLSYNIRIFSINLAISDVATSITGFIVIIDKGSLVSEEMKDDCLMKLLTIYSMMWLYFTSSFIITAVGIDRFISIAYPYRYLQSISDKRGRIIRICGLIWAISFLVVVFHDLENDRRLYFCASRGYTDNKVVFFGFQYSKLRVIGFTNLCILIINIVTYVAIFAHIWRQKSEVRNRQYSTLGKLLTFTIAYAFLHGPLNTTTVISGLFDTSSFDVTKVTIRFKVVVIISLVAIVVDPILYVWRYTDCRLQMMMLLCHWNQSCVEKLRRKQSEFYSSYIINCPTERERSV